MIRDYSQEDYRRFWASPGKLLLHEAECGIIRNALPPSPGWFVDIGCGYGRLLPTYVALGRQIVLVDYAVHLLEMASQTYAQANIHFVAANAYRLPFRDGVFRSGLSVRTFHHMNVPQSFLSEFARVFQGGSSVMLSYSNKRNLLRILRHGLKCFRHDHEDTGEMVFVTHPAYFAKLSQHVGLQVQRTRATGFLDQMVISDGIFDRLLAKMPLMHRLAAFAENVADRTLGMMGLEPLHFALLRKEGEVKEPPTESETRDDLKDLLACPRCGGIDLIDHEDGFTCSDCGRRFIRKGKILDFRYEEGSGNE